MCCSRFANIDCKEKFNVKFNNLFHATSLVSLELFRIFQISNVKSNEKFNNLTIINLTFKNIILKNGSCP